VKVDACRSRIIDPSQRIGLDLIAVAPAYSYQRPVRKTPYFEAELTERISPAFSYWFILSIALVAVTVGSGSPVVGSSSVEFAVLLL
jgi:hypothetical protein